MVNFIFSEFLILGIVFLDVGWFLGFVGIYRFIVKFVLSGNLRYSLFVFCFYDFLKKKKYC